MNTQTQQGFTIIELMLFLSISAIVTMAALIGWTVNINTQSYRDGARSLAAELAQQYTDTTNVFNDRSPDQTCRDSDISDRTSTPVGQTDCVLMGRYIIMSGATLTEANIIGSGSSAKTNDLQAIQDYDPKPDMTQTSSYTIPWAPTPYLSKDTKDTKLNAAIAIVRSPVSGMIYTFIKTDLASDGGDTPSIGDIVNNGNGQQKLTICLDPGQTVATTTQAVVMDRYASSSSAVSVSAGDAAC